MAPPDFTNRALFPPFNDLPEASSASDDAAQEEPTPTLIAQVKDDMTITKPTLILTDRDAAPFALVFEGYDREEGIKFLKSKGLKKGVTVVLGNGLAKRVQPREDSKSVKAFVRVEKGREDEVAVIGGKMDKVFEIVERFRGAEEAHRGENGEGEGEEIEEEEEKEKKKGRCDACGKAGGGEDGSVGLLKCTGCGVARYCSKVSCFLRSAAWFGGGESLVMDVWERGRLTTLNLGVPGQRVD